MPRRKIHILHEYAIDYRPNSSSFIRLLRPLTHPALLDKLEVSFGSRYYGERADAVIIDRLWRPDISPKLAKEMIDRIHQAGARFIYAMDDNLFDLPLERSDWPKEIHLQTMHFFLDHADGVLVTTPWLKERIASYNSQIIAIPQALDERLLVRGRSVERHNLFKAQPITIGYMGTITHESDLLMILPALEAISHKFGKEVEIQIIGAIGEEDTFKMLESLSVRVLAPEPEEAEYPLFMLWFTGNIYWDIAIAPLRDTPFTRGKSDIKFLDYCAIAAAGIFSKVPAYEASVKHMETGLVIENEVAAWEEALETLFVDDALRARLADNANHYLYSQRILAHRAQEWLQAIDTILGI